MLDIQKFIGSPKIYVDVVDEKTTVFEMRYLPRGFAHTIGNALRRIILAYNVSAAVTALKIKGVPHEYHIIDGVKESVLDIMLNIKKLRFQLDDSVEPVQWVFQKFSGIGLYTSKHLKLPSGITVFDEDTYLFEITDPSVELMIDMRIEKGYGYYSIDFLRKREQKKSDSDINILLIDNDFKATEYVKYHVQEVIDDFSGSTKDALILEIKSLYKGISPQQLLSFSGEVLASYAKLFIFDDIYIDKSVLVSYDELYDQKDKVSDDMGVKTMPIDALPLSERTRNALIKNEILYVEDLEKKKKGELLLMKGVGRKAIDEINVALGNIGKMLIG